jgi:predicted enzyme related to lactoylglutathione lyase
MAIKKISQVTIIVRDQDEALNWYKEKMGFEVRTDDAVTMPGYRWLTIAPKEQKELEIVLFKARDAREQAWVGQGTLWMLQADDCRATCTELAARGVKILSEPQEYPWGIGATIEDLYGNPFNILQMRTT